MSFLKKPFEKISKYLSSISSRSMAEEFSRIEKSSEPVTFGEITPPVGKIEFTSADRNSAFGQKLAVYCEQRLFTLRSQNDNDLSEVETSKIRGRIHEIKIFMSLGKEVPKIDF